jgi:hypothetical protein
MLPAFYYIFSATKIQGQFVLHWHPCDLERVNTVFPILSQSLFSLEEKASKPKFFEVLK